MMEAIPLLFTPKCNTTISLHPFRRTVNQKHPFFNSLSCSLSKNFKINAAKKQEQVPELKPQNLGGENNSVSENGSGEGFDFGWLPAFPHVLTASLSNFLFGYHIGVMNGPIISIAKELGFEGNSFLEGLVVSIFIGGAFIGSISCGSLVDKLGCRRTFQLDTIPLILGAVVSAQAHSLNEILCGRFLVGLGIGVNTVLVPIYISEVAPTNYRGSLGTLSQIGTCLGIITSLLLAFPSESDPHWWRLMLYIASVPGFVLALGMQFAVDSPRWLCKAGRFDDAKEVINNIWGPSEVEKAIEEFQSVIRNDGADLDSSWLELLQEPHSRVAFIGGALFVLQQFAGINGVLYFSSLTFKDAGITSSSLASLFVGLTNFAGALCASYLMDKQGRKTLLVGSYLGMFSIYLRRPKEAVHESSVEKVRRARVRPKLTWHVVVAKDLVAFDILVDLATTEQNDEEQFYAANSKFIGIKAVSMFVIVSASSFPIDKEISSNLSILGTILYILTFAIGAGPVTGLIIPELSSSRTRGKILGFSFSVHWVCNFLVGLFFLELVEKFGIAPVYASFGGVSLLAAAFAYYFIVETKGRSLEEIEMSLNAGLQGRK